MLAPLRSPSSLNPRPMPPGDRLGPETCTHRASRSQPLDRPPPVTERVMEIPIRGVSTPVLTPLDGTRGPGR